MTPYETLTAVRRTEAQANTTLQTAQAALALVLHKHADYQYRFAEARARADSALPAQAVAAAAAVRDAETVLAASQRQVAAHQSDVVAASKAFGDAQNAIRAAVRQVVAATEAPELYETFEYVREQFLRLRARLLAHYLVLPEALSNNQWREVDCRNIASAEEMGIGLITEFRDTDWRKARAAVTVYERALRDRLAALERGEESAAEDKAAA